MSIEQMGAVLLVFEMLAILFCFLRDRRVNLPLLIQTFLISAAFAVLFVAPGNQLRVASEITTWMPEYETLTFGRHLFITAQWLLSSFANENKLFCCGIWVAGSILLLQSERRSPADLAAAGLAAIYTVAALLPFAGITVLSDMGMQVTDITVRVDEIPAPEDLTGANMAVGYGAGVYTVFSVEGAGQEGHADSRVSGRYCQRGDNVFLAHNVRFRCQSVLSDGSFVSVCDTGVIVRSA